MTGGLFGVTPVYINKSFPQYNTIPLPFPTRVARRARVRARELYRVTSGDIWCLLYQLAPRPHFRVARARQVPQPSRATWLVVRQVRKVPPTRAPLPPAAYTPAVRPVLHVESTRRTAVRRAGACVVRTGHPDSGHAAGADAQGGRGSARGARRGQRSRPGKEGYRTVHFTVPAELVPLAPTGSPSGGAERRSQWSAWKVHLSSKVGRRSKETRRKRK